MLKIDILTFGKDYRVVLLFKRYLNAKEIMLASLKALRQFQHALNNYFM